jgi:hypothetical protein
MEMHNLPMSRYCPKSKYPLDTREIIKMIAEIEDQWNEEYTPPPLPKYEKKEIKWTPASLVGFAGNCVRSILP